MDETIRNAITEGIHELGIMSHGTAKSKGFWDQQRNKGEMIALIHSEVSELLEAVRKPGPSDHIPPHTLEAEELADIIVRVMDYAYGHNIDVGSALIAKLQYNATRPHKHGKNF